MHTNHWKSASRSLRSDKVSTQIDVRPSCDGVYDFDCLVPRKVVKQRKDGHVRADDDDDEPLLLDQPTKYTPEGTKSQPSSTLKPTQNDTSLASESTFVNNPTPSSVLVKGAEKGEKMDIDSETEDEDEGKDDMDNKNVRQKAGDQPAEQLETPPPTLRSLDQSESQAESQSQFQSQSQSQFIASESGSQPLAPTNSQISNVTFSAVPSSSSSRIGLARPLQDFKAALKADKSGGRDLLRGLVKELGEVVREIVVAPLSGRRYEEMRECLREAKEVCYKASFSTTSSGLSIKLINGFKKSRSRKKRHGTRTSANLLSRRFSTDSSLLFAFLL